MNWPYITTHAYERWNERTNSPGIGPRAAWIHAEPADPDGVDGDEVRYHEDTNTYLVVQGPRLVTVLPAREPPGWASPNGVVA